MGDTGGNAVLGLVGAMFDLADDEHRRRRDGAVTPAASSTSAADEDFAALVRTMDVSGLREVRGSLAHSLLREVDLMLGEGTPSIPAEPNVAPGSHEAPDVDVPTAPTMGPRVALVSMPWMSPTMPSVQLGTLDAVLRGQDVHPTVLELYVDFAARIGVPLYKRLSRAMGFNAEWVFARHYFGPVDGLDLEGFLDDRPDFGLFSAALEVRVLRALSIVAREWLDDLVAGVDWGAFELVGFSLTVSQLAGSLALAHRLKEAHPHLPIVFGGAQCAGPMGRAMLRCFPAVDVVVQVEGEPVIVELARRVHDGLALDDMPGVAWRTPDGDVRHRLGEVLDVRQQDRPLLCYDAYFARLRQVGLDDVIEPWVPFESSRGCWYGEKVQCTFCGLHDIMDYRDQTDQRVLEELEHLWSSHGVHRFFAVDLIMPRVYLETLLPAIEASDRDWRFFYEVKANMKRHEVEQLARAGVRWIQPGIESLDAEVLGLMRKGVRPLQNLQLLKWCGELGIRASWNVIRGLPNERAESYEGMTELLPLLWHLRPPAGVAEFQLHRFSPYFEEADDFGIRSLGAHPHYDHVFPVPQPDRDDLVYLHDYELDGDPVPAEVAERFERAVHAWRRAHTAGASLLVRPGPDGTGIVVDRRVPDVPPRLHHLSADDLALYLHLDTARTRASLRERWPEPDRLDTWVRDGLVLELDGRVLGLGQRADVMARHAATTDEGTSIAYLDEDLLPTT